MKISFEETLYEINDTMNTLILSNKHMKSYIDSYVYDMNSNNEKHAVEINLRDIKKDFIDKNYKNIDYCVNSIKNLK